MLEHFSTHDFKSSLLVLLFITIFSGFVQSKECQKCRYTSSIFDSVTTETVKFGKGVNADGQMQELFMDVYQPYGDTASQRPVFVFAFGGGFIQGSRDDDYVQRVCRKLAETGYVAAAIDYRTGIDVASGILGPVEEFMRVFFRPMQDMRGAIQYFKAHADSMGNTYRVDTNMIIVGGGSSGAITAMNVAYADSAEYAEIGDISAIDNLGGFRSTSGFYKGYNWDDIAAVFNVAGGMVEADWVDPGEPPLISAHGDEDNTVPYRGGNFGIAQFTIGLEGSFLIDSMAKERGVCSYLFTLEGVGHPSGSSASLFINKFVNRAFPRMQAVVERQTFCCDLDVAITPPSNDTIMQGDTISLTASMINDSANAKLHWCSTPFDFFSTDSQITVQPTPPNFYIAVADQGNCQASDFIATFKPTPPDTATSVPPHLPSSSITAYPNPASESVTLKVGSQSQPARVKLLDMAGRIRATIELQPPQKAAKIDLSYLPQGVYFLHLTTGNQVIGARKLMVR